MARRDPSTRPVRRSALQRALVVVLAVATAAMLGYAAYLGWDTMRPLPQSAAAPVPLTYPQMLNGESDGGADTRHPLAPLFAGTPDPRSPRVQGVDQPLATEPLDLPPYPGATGRQGIRRDAAGVSEQVVFWRLPDADADAVLDHYRRAAAAIGFEVARQTRPTGDRGGQTLILVRQPPGSDTAPEVLLIRVAAAGGAGHDALALTLWLRQAARMP